MRYIGSKTNLLEKIVPIILNKADRLGTFCDIFAGTGAVGRRFKKEFSVISNDLLYFSYVLQKASIEINVEPAFENLKKVINSDPFSYFANLDEKKFKFSKAPFIYENYSPNEKSERMYLTNSNALRIDAMRQSIDDWKSLDLISELEYFYLLAGIIESVPFVSNIAGTYGAFLKHWDSRTTKKIDLVKLEIENNNKKNQCFNQDANDLIKKISGDVLYIDPPYNGRQYLSNYHLLETIAKYDEPTIKGVTGTRLDGYGNSNYCKKKDVLKSFDDLVSSANFNLIVVSYSNEGIMSEEEIAETLKKYCNNKTLQIERIPYRRYKRTSDQIESNLNELLFTIRK